MPRVILGRRAGADLREILLYIREHDPRAARRLLDQFNARLDLLGRFPEMGAARPDLRKGLRSSPVGNYLVFYQPTKKAVDVVRILHGARNLKRIFRRRR